MDRQQIKSMWTFLLVIFILEQFNLYIGFLLWSGNLEVNCSLAVSSMSAFTSLICCNIINNEYLHTFH